MTRDQIDEYARLLLDPATSARARLVITCIVLDNRCNVCGLVHIDGREYAHPFLRLVATQSTFDEMAEMIRELGGDVGTSAPNGHKTRDIHATDAPVGAPASR